MIGLKYIALLFIVAAVNAVAGFGQPPAGNSPVNEAYQVHFDTTLIHPAFSFINSLHDDNYYKECVGPDTLRDGSIVCYGAAGMIRYLFLQKEDSLYLLNTVEATSFWHLGVLEAEYKNSFMIRHDQGNGCPPTYELFSKKTGRNMIGAHVEFDDYLWVEHSLYLLYLDSSKKKIALYNVTTARTEYYGLPASLAKYHTLNFESLSASDLTIRYSDFLNSGDELTASYPRIHP